MGDDLTKMKKKEKKAQIKALKKQLKEASNSGKSPIIKEIIKETPARKDWRSNIWLYTAVAIVVGIILWGITYFLNLFVGV